MTSQSAFSLPVVYEPFDGRKRGHFVDRGQILDFFAVLGSGRILDFGPGDGWPSLPLASMVDRVDGVDGSPRRIDVCRANAERLGITNAFYHLVLEDGRLPFEDEAFDGVAAASSVEQTPDVKKTLREINRVLKPGGKLRMHYESLDGYRGTREIEVEAGEVDPGRTRVVIYDRDIEGECVDHFGLLVAGSPEELALGRDRTKEINRSGEEIVGFLRRIKPRLLDAVSWRTTHPSRRTYLRLLEQAGFAHAQSTYDGGWFAGRLYDRIPEERRPPTLEAVDEMLRPVVEVVVDMPFQPATGEAWITAVK